VSAISSDKHGSSHGETFQADATDYVNLKRPSYYRQDHAVSHKTYKKWRAGPYTLDFFHTKHFTHTNTKPDIGAHTHTQNISHPSEVLFRIPYQPVRTTNRKNTKPTGPLEEQRMDQAKERFMVGWPQVRNEVQACTPQVLGCIRQEFDGLKMLLKSFQLLLK